MKKIIGIALALALVLGIAAFAEETTTDPAPAAPAVTEEATPAEAAAPGEDAAEESSESTDTNAALQDALDAYRKAKQDKAVDDLEEELAEYVAAGSLTQEQADLILNSVKERLAAKNGECPNCGYDLRGQNKGGMKGQQRGKLMGGMKGQQRGKMGGMNGQMPGNNQTPDQQTPQMNGQIPGQQMPGMAPQM